MDCALCYLFNPTFSPYRWISKYNLGPITGCNSIKVYTLTRSTCGKRLAAKKKYELGSRLLKVTFMIKHFNKCFFSLSAWWYIWFSMFAPMALLVFITCLQRAVGIAGWGTLCYGDGLSPLPSALPRAPACARSARRFPGAGSTLRVWFWVLSVLLVWCPGVILSFRAVYILYYYYT